MNVIKPVVIKQILTETRKQRLLDQLAEEYKQAEREIEQLTFQLHKKLKNDTTSIHKQREVKESFQYEIHKRKEKLKAIEFKREQLNRLQIGIEINDGSIDSMIEVNVGDRWDDVVSGQEIIIKDGIVHEIRKGRSNDDKMV
ncbi:YlqD family protein [Desertibacillus haloalkaliphilus]|uniref:YlqD family protein n=1 Tax=Desertibacillus haloalkaliphilus TaxID=1328930 RepID=UPI001C27098A|nr:YlqD family protein [Desertibacillus haloalkaliphilus]MBU8907037.1 YlqD family protein [Desertibacillus haloalkaliphilus]